ncbi:MAG: M3 family metallopeptidase [Candidatus Protistobacter heckmanni]|nr:M3 family metallopeptidase [Candidatus Protistobacter heckmanni]
MSATPASTDNPLLDFSGLPRFQDVRPEHIEPALDALLDAARAAVAKAEDPATPATWDAVAQAMEDATEPLFRAWSVVGHLSAVADTPALREAHARKLPRMTDFSSSLGQNLALFKKYKAIAEGPEFASLSPARRKVLENSLRDFRLGGAELPDAEKPRFAKVQEEQARLSKEFSDHVLDATNAYGLYVTDAAEFAGLPQDVIDAAREAARKDKPEAAEPGWKFTLHFPSYFPVLQYAERRALRETLYRASATRASELGPQYGQGKVEWDNTQNIVEQLRLRLEEARTLGYPNYAELSLVPKMARSAREVVDFLGEMASRARPFAEKDWVELQSFAKDMLGIAELQPWDIAYASEKLREASYAFSEDELRQYFPETKVLPGLFHVIEKLFSVRIFQEPAQTWHPDVKFFRVETLQGGLLAQFYLDLYAREGKRGGAWMDDARGRKRLHPAHGQAVQTPVAYLVCNFPAPVGGRPALLTHDDVITLFHEFGHGLHHMLTEVDELGVSGISGVEWDAVELPSQFMENFCWEWDVLQGMTAHADTGEPLPRALFERMLAAKNFQNGLGTLRQVVFSLFDLQLHADFDPAPEEGPGEASRVLALSREINARIHVVPQVAFSRWPHTFSHIFAGGYAAGYYSYKWAEVLSADAYAAFEEAAETAGTVLDADTGSRYLREILQSGGSRPMLESFRAFRGRDPSIHALLRHGGLSAAPAPAPAV